MLWKAIGGEIFLEPHINFTHTGMKQFKGNFHEYLMGRKVKVEDFGELDKNSEGLDGWMKPEELEVIKTLARQSGSVVEVGSWKGRSTKVLLENCKGPVYAVDHWKGTSTDLSILMAAGQDVYSKFIENVGHYPNLNILRGDSVDMAAAFNGNRVDMVFLDADHTYEGLKSDLEAWVPKCNRFICGHDYEDSFPGVIRAVDEKFDKANLTGSLWWVEL
jgi:hypothetical protein